MLRPSRRSILRGTWAAASLPFLPHFALRSRRRARVNVLFVVTDQHHWSALSCAGNDDIETPNLDRLASGGTRFTSAISASGQCGPSRYSIWTGRHVRGHKLLKNGMRGDVQRPALGELFRAAGYRTASIGKHHMKSADLVPEHGFDHVVEREDHERLLARMNRTRAVSQGKLGYRFQLHALQAGTSPLSNELHESAFWVDRAVNFMRKGARDPFCAWVSFYGPHSPIQPSEPWASRYEPSTLRLPPNNKADSDADVPGLASLRETQALTTRRQRELLALYYGYISQIDHNLGRLFEALDDAGRAQDTLVCFTADHGELMGEHGVWTKGYYGYDATLRVPLIVRLPGAMPEGEVRSDLVSSVDLLPSILSLAGVEAPDDLHGRTSLIEADPGRRFAFAETGVRDKRRATICRTKTAKHVRFTLRDELVYEQFFDLLEDPWETSNAIAAAREDGRLEELRKQHEAWLADDSGGEPAAARKKAPR